MYRRRVVLKRLDGKDLLIRELKQDIDNLKIENEQLRAERDNLKYCLDETRKSFSYRLGLALTSIPRKIKGQRMRNVEE